MWKIPLFDTDFGDAERRAALRPLESGWLTMGPATQQLESEFAERTGARHAIAVTNCTAALHLALAAAGVGPGDEVIVPSLTFIASANAARYCGADVVFAEVVGAGDLTLDPEDVARRITSKTRAIVVVHYAGFPAAMDRLEEIAAEHRLVIIEDCAHALFTRWRGRALGTLGDAGCFSFFSNKNLTCGEGGMIVTDRDGLADRLKRARSHGMTTLTLDRHRGRAWSYDCLDLGWNYRIDEIRASVALAQLERLPRFLAERARVRRCYLEELEGVGVEVPFAHWDGLAEPEISVGYHIMPVLLPAELQRAEVMDALKREGIQSSVHYPPAHLFSMARDEGHPPLPVTEEVALRELTLPLYPGMEAKDVRMVCRALRSAIEA